MISCKTDKSTILAVGFAGGNRSCRAGNLGSIVENLLKIVIQTAGLINQEANAYNDSQKQSIFYQILTLFTEVWFYMVIHHIEYIKSRKAFYQNIKS